ncbi:hypothetical protein SGLAM104S_09676 [Streptomyces glaucescens]
MSGAGGRPQSTTRVPASLSLRSFAATAAACGAFSMAPPVGHGGGPLPLQQGEVGEFALGRAAGVADDGQPFAARASAGAADLGLDGARHDPEKGLEGYWGATDLDAATDTFLEVIAAHPDKVDGIKVSLLDAQREIDLRRRLPQGVRCYTGDDFNYPELIAGDDQGFSHALLGIFDPLGPLAAEAVRVLDTGDTAGFRGLLDPTVELSRHLFQAPTRFYKTGVVFLAWLAGHQSHFTMVGGLQSARSLPHFARAYELADGLGLFPDPKLAEERMKTLLAMYGVAQ